MWISRSAPAMTDANACPCASISGIGLDLAALVGGLEHRLDLDHEGRVEVTCVDQGPDRDGHPMSPVVSW